MSYCFVSLYNKLSAKKIPSEGHYVVTINRKVCPLYRQGQAGGPSGQRNEYLASLVHDTAQGFSNSFTCRPENIKHIL